jgi:hypothetical protein
MTTDRSTPDVRAGLLRERHPRATEHMEKTAAYEVGFGRIGAERTDEFTASIRPCPDADREKTGMLTIQNVLVIMPIGNDWRQALGRSSYCVIPFESLERCWIAIGFEVVVSHSSRGAHPISEAFVYEYPRGSADASRALRILAEELMGGETVVPQGMPPLPLGDCARAGDDDLALDAAMLRQAADDFERGRTLFVRTRLLTPSMHPSAVFKGLSSLGQRVIGDRWIVGVVDAVDVPRPRVARETRAAAAVAPPRAILALPQISPTSPAPLVESPKTKTRHLWQVWGTLRGLFRTASAAFKLPRD